MLFAATDYSAHVLRAAVESLPIPETQRLKAAAKHLYVPQKTLAAWMQGTQKPPRSAVFALWHESPQGRAAVAAHSEHGAQLWRSLSKSQSVHIADLRAKIDALTHEVHRLKFAAHGPQPVNDAHYKMY